MFITDDFMLYNDVARELYHEVAEKLPIIDYHNHLNPQEIAEDKRFDNITSVWLGGDHYKWRAMRAMGYSEKLITGDALDINKFKAYADTVNNAFGNPLYHWTHLELKRYFGIDEVLSPKTADMIWDKTNEMLSSPSFSAANLLRKQKVKVLCTTDDPVDDLKWHKQIGVESDFSVFPSFRPDKALYIEREVFKEYIEKLSEVSDVKVEDVESLLAALKVRLEYFVSTGCRVTDHSLENDFYISHDKVKADTVLKKRLKGELVTDEEAALFRGYLLSELGKLYAENGLVMQLHIGALRNNSTRLSDLVGADCGVDGMNDFEYAPQLSMLLNEMDKEDKLPRTILYYLNPKDAYMLVTLAGCFTGNDEGIRNKVQVGSAWWFNDHVTGMEQHMQMMCDYGMISGCVGMLTDSRSFLSFPRHEYFRRILCNFIGEKVEKGQFPKDMETLGRIVSDVCYENAVRYFNFSN